MSAKEPTRVIELLQLIAEQNKKIQTGIDELLSGTKEVRKINDNQLTELKKPK